MKEHRIVEVPEVSIFFDILSLNIRCPVLRGRCRCKKLSATASTDSAKLSWAVAIAGHFADYG